MEAYGGERLSGDDAKKRNRGSDRLRFLLFQSQVQNESAHWRRIASAWGESPS